MSQQQEKVNDMKMTMDLQQTQKVELHTTLCRRCHAPQRLNDNELCGRCESLPEHAISRLEERTDDAQVLLIVLAAMAAMMLFGWAVSRIAEVLQ